jgi:hypothetical protein
MATRWPSSLARIRSRPVGLASSLVGRRVAGPVFELPVSGPAHSPATIAEKVTPAGEAKVENAQATRATAHEIVTNRSGSVILRPFAATDVVLIGAPARRRCR